MGGAIRICGTPAASLRPLRSGWAYRLRPSAQDTRRSGKSRNVGGQIPDGLLRIASRRHAREILIHAHAAHAHAAHAAAHTTAAAPRCKFAAAA